MKFAIAPLLAAAFVMPASHAALQGRDLDTSQAGFEAYYDAELDITWLTDFALITHQGVDADGKLSWDGAQSWIASLNQQKLYGVDGWRLPKVEPLNGSYFQGAFSFDGSTDIGLARTGQGWGTASEMGHLYYVTLGNLSYCVPTADRSAACTVQPGWDQKNLGPFKNLQTFLYWADVQGYPTSSTQMAYFSAYEGYQGFAAKSTSYGAIAVRDGDIAVTAVPEPGTWALMVAGLVGLGLRARRSR
jgi:hypothetical protein